MIWAKAIEAGRSHEYRPTIADLHTLASKG